MDKRLHSSTIRAGLYVDRHRTQSGSICGLPSTSVFNRRLRLNLSLMDCSNHGTAGDAPVWRDINAHLLRSIIGCRPDYSEQARIALRGFQRIHLERG